MMRICIVNPFFQPYDGGIERRIKAIGKRLSDEHEINVVTSQLKGTKKFDEIKGIKVHRLPSRYINIYNPPWVFSRGIKGKISELSPDIIHFHYRWSIDYTRAVASFLGEIPTVFTWHNYFGEGVGWQRALSLLNDELFKHLLINKCDKVICVSKNLKNQLLSKNINEKKLEVIYNGIEPKERSEEEEDFILFVGRLVQTKGLDVLAEAMENIDYKLKICGKGPHDNELDNNDNIELLGFVPEKEKNRLLRKCKFLVLPSKKEAFGIALLEAMAFGKPVIATRTGGIPEVVGDAGILVPPDDTKELESAIKTMLSNDELRRELGEKAWKRAKLFSWDEIASQIEDLYQKII
ncbi:MAG: glycosyltransferase family 4 protein [Hadesarchaea archaeon]|nr:glycosyltransferase family 4 protein [Hadesarchaea archaeon]